jgi:regulator of replication initiation timing
VAEYRIVAKIDPQTAAGAQAVKTDLKGIQTEALSTGRAINNTFDQAKYDQSIAKLTARVGTLEKSLRDLKKTNGELTAENRQLAESIDKVGASSSRVVTNSSRMDDSLKKTTVSLGMQRAGFTQLGFQIQDWTQQLSAGVNPLTVISQQSGQTASALSMALGTAGTAGKVATFMAGPFGSVLLAGGVILGGLAAKALLVNTELNNSVEAMKKDAHETDINRQAKELFKTTTEGVTKAIYDQREAFKKLDEARRSEAEQTSIETANDLARIKRIRDETDALLAKAQAAIQVAMQPQAGGEFSIPGAPMGVVTAQVDRLERLRKANQDAATAADENYRKAQANLFIEKARDDSTKEGKENRDFKIRQDALEATYRTQMLVTTEYWAQVRLTAQLRKDETALADAHAARLKAIQKENREVSDGVARFKSREQAIGIVGTELQRQGLRVGENNQFGGVHATHPGMGSAAHGKYAIDVNSGTGTTEANIPDLKAKFDVLARRYQQRGYRVLWNGQVYEANGNGPTGPIRTGDQHRDHLHVEAPATIVGKATNASTEAQAEREESVADQQSDFIGSIVSQAGAKAPANQREALAGQIEKMKEDFKRRFNVGMNPDQLATGTKALTDADARETAQHFTDAYVVPLQRLQALQGKTGADRKMLNAELNETIRLGRELTPVEKEQIDNGIRQGDQLERQAAILESVRGPIDEYKAQLKALNDLLAAGAINQTSYNARIGDLGQTARNSIRDLPGKDPGTGSAYNTLAGEGDEQSRYDHELDLYQNNREQLLKMGINYDALLEAAHRRHIRNMNNIDAARQTLAIESAQNISESLLSIAEASVGRQSAIYKGLFILTKAFAIADSIVKIQQGIANALSLPFPENLAAAAIVAAQAASIISNIQAVKLNLAAGGYVSGPGTGTSDSIPANLSNGEYVMNARATAENRALLDALNSGRVMAGTRQIVASNDYRRSTAVGGDSYSLSFGDVIVQGGGGDPVEIGRAVKAQLQTIIRAEIANAKRPGGALTTSGSSVMTG